EKRAESERFAGSPIDRLIFLDHSPSLVELAFDFGVHLQVRGNDGQTANRFLESFAADAGGNWIEGIRRLENGAGSFEFLLGISGFLLFFYLLKSFIENLLELGDHLLGSFLAEGA